MNRNLIISCIFHSGPNRCSLSSYMYAKSTLPYGAPPSYPSTAPTPWQEHDPYYPDYYQDNQNPTVTCYSGL